MYAHFYHLSENPFNLTPDPKFHYINESTREAMASILHGIRSRKGFLTLIGEAGTGKTTLLKRVLDEIEGETRVVFVFNPGVSFDELLEFICMELGIPTDGRRRLQLLDRLNAYLLEQLTAGCNVVVMIDEAQTLDDAVLEELRLLSNLETSKEKILQILLSGQPELEEKLRRPNLRQLRQRIAVRAVLRPMRPGEIGAYVETRLQSAGAERNDFFTPPALRKIWQASGGIPRVINVICDNAMMIAFAEGKRRLGVRVINEAVRDLHGRRAESLGERMRSWFATPRTWYAAGAVALVALALPFALSTRAGDRDRGGFGDQVRPGSETAVAAAVDEGAKRGEVARDDGIDSAVRGASGDGSGLRPEGEARIRRAEREPLLEEPVRESIEQARNVARATAARLYGGRTRGAPEETIAREALEQRAEPVDDAFDLEKTPALEARLARELGRVTTDDSVRSAPARGGVADMEAEAAALLRAPLAPAERDVFAETDEETEAVSPSRAPSRAQGARRPPAAGASENVVPRPVKAASVPVEQSVLRERSTAQEPETEAAATPAPPAAASSPAAAAPRAADTAEPVSAVAPVAAAQPRASAPAVAGEGGAAESSGATAGTPLLRTPGQLVRVAPRDTIWDIAIAYYGTAGPVTLKRILNANPRIRDPRRLEVGGYIFLPFQRPEQMVQTASDGSFRLLIASAPSESALGDLGAWAQRSLPGARVEVSRVSGSEPRFELYLAGIQSREQALTTADTLLGGAAKIGRVAGEPRT